jgi:hypothetical protein
MTARTRIQIALLALLVSGLTTGASACPGLADDPDEIVAPHCDSIPAGVDDPLTYGEVAGTYLTADCKSALEGVFPFDEKSFEQAPAGVHDKVLEAFQTLLAFPIARPKTGDLLFGTSDPHIGPIAAQFFAEFGADSAKERNRALFNYVANRIAVVQYSTDVNSGMVAECTPSIKPSPCVLTIYPRFWNPAVNVEDDFRHPFDRAAMIMHEARHGDGIAHVNCPLDDKWECDPELEGPHGFEVDYLKYLLHGSAACDPSVPPDQCKPVISDFGKIIIAKHMCNALQRWVLKKYPSLDQLLGGPAQTGGSTVDCNDGTVAVQLLEAEGIPLTD